MRSWSHTRDGMFFTNRLASLGLLFGSTGCLVSTPLLVREWAKCLLPLFHLIGAVTAPLLWCASLVCWLCPVSHYLNERVCVCLERWMVLMQKLHLKHDLKVSKLTNHLLIAYPETAVALLWYQMLFNEGNWRHRHRVAHVKLLTQL